MGLSCWDEGSKAARSNLMPDDCPYNPDQYDWVTWMNGWIATYHAMQKQPAIEKKEEPECRPMQQEKLC